MSLHTDTKYIRLLSFRLRNFKQKKDYLWNFSCPICGDSKKNPNKARGYVYQKGNDLYYGCHNCGAGTNLANLIKHIDVSLHHEYVMERYVSGESNKSNFKPEKLSVKTFRFDKVEVKSYENAERCDKLPSDHFCVKYLETRKIPKKFYSKLFYTDNFKKFCDEVYPNHDKELTEDKRLIIPFYDQYNVLIAISGRALENASEKLRYVTIRTNDSDDKLIYGLDRVDLKKPVKIVEGPIDSLFLENCIASCDSALAITAKKINCADVTLIYDNEPRNKEIISLMKKSINSNSKVVIWPEKIVDKDINQMIQSGITNTELEKIISSNTFTGLQALTQFTFWKKL